MFRCSREAKYNYSIHGTSICPILEYAAVVCGVHMLPGILSYWSLFRVGLPVGFMVAIGVQQLHDGLSQHVIVVPSFVF